MFALFLGDTFFYLPIVLAVYAVVDAITKRVSDRKVQVSGLRHTIAIVCISLLSSATASVLAVLNSDSNLLPQSGEPNQLIIAGLPIIYSMLFAYLVRAVPSRHIDRSAIEAEKPPVQTFKTLNPTNLKTITGCLAVALVLALSYIFFNRQPRSYDECIIRNTQAAQTTAAVNVIRASCRNLFPGNRFGGIPFP